MILQRGVPVFLLLSYRLVVALWWLVLMYAWGLLPCGLQICRLEQTFRQICSCLVKKAKRWRDSSIWLYGISIWLYGIVHDCTLAHCIIQLLLPCSIVHRITTLGIRVPPNGIMYYIQKKNSWKNQDVYCSIVCAPTGGACCFGCRRNSRMVSENQPSASFGTYHEDSLLLRPTLLTGHPRFPVSPAGPCSPNFT